jgi:hypothetical protein
MPGRQSPADSEDRSVLDEAAGRRPCRRASAAVIGFAASGALLVAFAVLLLFVGAAGSALETLGQDPPPAIRERSRAQLRDGDLDVRHRFQSDRHPVHGGGSLLCLGSSGSGGDSNAAECGCGHHRFSVFAPGCRIGRPNSIAECAATPATSVSRPRRHQLSSRQLG